MVSLGLWDRNTDPICFNIAIFSFLAALLMQAKAQKPGCRRAPAKKKETTALHSAVGIFAMG